MAWLFRGAAIPNDFMTVAEDNSSQHRKPRNRKRLTLHSSGKAGLIFYGLGLGRAWRPRVSAASGSCCRAGANRSGREHSADGSHGPESKYATLAGAPQA